MDVSCRPAWILSLASAALAAAACRSSGAGPAASPSSPAPAASSSPVDDTAAAAAGEPDLPAGEPDLAAGEPDLAAGEPDLAAGKPDSGEHGDPPRDPPPPGVEVRTDGPYEVWIRRTDRGRTTLTCWSSSRDDHASGFCGTRPNWTLRFHAVSIQGSNEPRMLRVALRHALEPGFRACQDAAPAVTGTAELKAVIRADGGLVDTAVTGLGDAGVEGCMAKAMTAARVARALPTRMASATWRVTLARVAASP